MLSTSAKCELSNYTSWSFRFGSSASVARSPISPHSSVRLNYVKSHRVTSGSIMVSGCWSNDLIGLTQ
jgi:hypothetical protein